jgi:PIN domain nuclease of toxin-antitoxin system
VAAEIAVLETLRDPADRVIVATARVHRLRLVTSDQRIIDSRLVAVVE